MINKIIMRIDDYTVLIDNESNKCIINDKVCALRNDDVSNIIRIIRDWDYDYRNNKVISETHYSIVVFLDKKEYNYSFDGKIPDNFLELVNYVGDIYGR